MIARQIENELVIICQQLKSITVEIADRRGGGAGVIWSSNGLIVTNSHVARDAKVNVKLEDERMVKGRVITRDCQKDLAVIQVENQQLPKATIGETQRLRPGEMVLAMGSPWGLSGALTTGVIHASRWNEVSQLKYQSKPTSFKATPATSAIVADIRLAPGNSGGVLANVHGEVIGINTAIYWGLALAVPAEEVTALIQSLSP